VYVFDVREILDDPGAAIPLRDAVRLPDIELGSELFRSAVPAQIDAVLSWAGAGIVLSGTVTTTLNAICSRCLREFPLTITAELDGFYVHHGIEDELPEEQEYEYIDDGSVDSPPRSCRPSRSSCPSRLSMTLIVPGSAPAAAPTLLQVRAAVVRTCRDRRSRRWPTFSATRTTRKSEAHARGAPLACGACACAIMSPCAGR